MSTLKYLTTEELALIVGGDDPINWDSFGDPLSLDWQSFSDAGLLGGVYRGPKSHRPNGIFYTRWWYLRFY